MRLQFPRGMPNGQRLRFLAPALFHRNASRQPFKTITMERAAARKRISRPIVRHANVAHLRMQQAMHHASVHKRTTTDTRANRQIQKIIEVLRRTPAPFTEGSAIHIGINAHWQPKCAAERTRKTGILPAGFGC